VGNLTFNTTEEQLREIFSFAGPVKNVRILTDKETGKPKGFAFVEYFDSNAALSAIRHLDQTELNSRKLKVGFPAQGNLKEVARQIGQVVPETAPSSSGGGGNAPISAATRQNIEQSVVNSLKLHEAWDLLDAMKKLVAEDNNRGNKAKSILETHPQLISALYEIQKRLGIALPKHIQQQQVLSSAAAAGTTSTSTGDVAATANTYSIAGSDGRSTSTLPSSGDYDYRREAYREYDNQPGGARDWDRERERDPRDARDRGDRGDWERPPADVRHALPLPASGNIRASRSAVPSYHDHPYGDVPPVQERRSRFN